MKTANFSKFILTCLMAVGAVVFSASISQSAPAQTTLTAPVEFVVPITIGNTTSSFDFGQIIPPTSASQNFTVRTNGQEVAFAGDGQFVPGTTTAGFVTGTGPAGTTVGISTNVIGGSSGGIVCQPVTPATGTVTLGAVFFPNAAVGGPDVTARTLTIADFSNGIPMGGTIIVDPTAAAVTGSHNCNYTLSVDFIP